MICFLACKSKDKSSDNKTFNIVTPVNVADYINPDDSFICMMKDLADENFLAIYPGLAQKYRTPLQAENFKNSQEFKEVQADMKAELNSLLKQTYVMPIQDFRDHSGIGDYDLKTGSFGISYQSSFGDADPVDIKSKRIKCFWFTDLNIQTFAIPHETSHSYTIFHSLFFNVDKETAVKIEGADLWLIFNLKNSFKENYIETRDVGIIIVDPATKKFLYGQKYSNFDENTAWKKKEK